MLQLILTTLLLMPVLVEPKAEWSYQNLKNWVRGNRYCAGKSQSPIDLRFNISHYDRRLKHMIFDERHHSEPVELTNNGHTAQIHLKNHYVLKNVAPESEEYNVEQVHFHWGHSTDTVNGSEHLHEGRSYPLEMHVVTYSNWHQNIHDAMTTTRGLAVVGVFFELSDEPNALLQPLVDALQHVRTQGHRVNVTAQFSLKALIGEERMHRYYRYDGSLTTPPCYESVIWTVLLEPLKLSRSQLHAFRYLHDDNGKLIENTYRPVKPLGTRKLFRSFYSEDIHEDHKQRMAMAQNNGQDLTKNMKLIVVLTSLLMVIAF